MKKEKESIKNVPDGTEKKIRNRINRKKTKPRDAGIALFWHLKGNRARSPTSKIVDLKLEHVTVSENSVVILADHRSNSMDRHTVQRIHCNEMAHLQHHKDAEILREAEIAYASH